LSGHLHVLPAADSPTRDSAAPESCPLIAIGASTGGTEAIRTVLSGLPQDSPGIVIVQHIARGFTALLADTLNGALALDVKEASDGDLVESGKVLIAPAGRHMIVDRRGGRLAIRLGDGHRVQHQRPSVDILFGSIARSGLTGAIGVLLTGRGEDGADGLLNMRNSGSHTIAQDEESSVVFGMPRAAIERGAACEVMSLDEVPRAVRSRFSRPMKTDHSQVRLT
jgi:two-component system, chemotaxis family, protein-glutamate methylesterase/glutaminase